MERKKSNAEGRAWRRLSTLLFLSRHTFTMTAIHFKQRFHTVHIKSRSLCNWRTRLSKCQSLTCESISTQTCLVWYAGCIDQEELRGTANVDENNRLSKTWINWESLWVTRKCFRTFSPVPRTMTSYVSSIVSCLWCRSPHRLCNTHQQQTPNRTDFQNGYFLGVWIHSIGAHNEPGLVLDVRVSYPNSAGYIWVWSLIAFSLQIDTDFANWWLLRQIVCKLVPNVLLMHTSSSRCRLPATCSAQLN